MELLETGDLNKIIKKVFHFEQKYTIYFSSNLMHKIHLLECFYLSTILDFTCIRC